MKKVLTLVVALALVVSAAAVFTFAGAAEDALIVPLVTTAPTIDGTIADGEWPTSMKISLDANNAAWKSASSAASADFYYCYDANGLYIRADVKDAKLDATKYAAGAVLNVTDGIQIEIDPTNAKEAGYNKSYIFDFAPQSTAGGAVWYEHFRWANGTEANIVEVASSITSDGYIIEICLKWDALKKLGETFEVKEGTKMGFDDIIMDIDGTNNALIADVTGICDASTFRTFTLGGAGSASTPATPSSTPSASSGCGNKN